jgi:hypothetical protein
MDERDSAAGRTPIRTLEDLQVALRDTSVEELRHLIAEAQARRRTREKWERFRLDVFRAAVIWLTVFLLGGAAVLVWRGGRSLFPHLP